MAREGRWPALRVAGVYLVVGAAWIAFSDTLVDTFVPAPLQTRLQTFKGFVFVGLSATLIFFLVAGEVKRRREAAGGSHWLSSSSSSKISGGPAMGSNFWTYDGDPPQEPMGMYSVFDPEDNSTLAIIATEAARMAGLVPIRGDANGDGKVDGADLNAWQNNYDPLGLNQNDWSMGDWNGDGKVDGARV